MRGRKPLPTAVHKANGNPSKKALNENEPRPPVGLGFPPADLSDAAKSLWLELAPQVEAMQVGAVVDRMGFTMLVESYAAWRELVVAARKDGPIIKVNGQMVPNPLLKRADKEWEKVRKLLPEFGITPSSRSRLHVDASGGNDDPLSEFMAGGDTPAPAPMRLTGG